MRYSYASITEHLPFSNRILFLCQTPFVLCEKPPALSNDSRAAPSPGFYCRKNRLRYSLGVIPSDFLKTWLK